MTKLTRSRDRRRLGATRLSVLVAAAALSVAGAGVAAASPQATSGHVSTFTAYGASTFNTFEAYGTERNGDPYQASGYVKGGPTPIRPIFNGNGRIVCLDIRGNALGAIYRFDDTSKPGTNKGVYLYITGIDGGPGHTDYVGTGPGAPIDLKLGCAPNPALNDFGPVTRGDIVIHDGRTS